MITPLAQQLATMASYDRAALQPEIDRLYAVYNRQPDRQKVAYINQQLDEAVTRPDAALDGLEKALLFMDAVSAFVKEVASRDHVEVDHSKLMALEKAYIRLTPGRVAVKQNKIQQWIGYDEYNSCFGSIDSLSANEQLQQYLARGQGVLCTKRTRRLLYAWLNYAMALRLTRPGRGTRRTPKVLRGDIVGAKSMLEAHLERTRNLDLQLCLVEERREFVAMNKKLQPYRRMFKQSALRLNRYRLYVHHEEALGDEDMSDDEVDRLISPPPSDHAEETDEDMIDEINDTPTKQPISKVLVNRPNETLILRRSPRFTKNDTTTSATDNPQVSIRTAYIILASVF